MEVVTIDMPEGVTQIDVTKNGDTGEWECWLDSPKRDARGIGTTWAEAVANAIARMEEIDNTRWPGATNQRLNALESPGGQAASGESVVTEVKG